MRYLFNLIMLLCCSTAAFGQTTAVNFRSGGWAQVLATAKKEHKPIMLYVWSPSCGPCREMARDVFPDPAVGQYYNATFINYKVNLDEGIGKQLGTQYGIVSLPAYLYFNSEGKLMHQTGSGKAAAAFIQDGKDAFDPQKTFFALKKRYKAGERNSDFLYRFSESSGLHQDMALARQVAEEYLKSQRPADLTSVKNLDFIFKLSTDFTSPMTQFFLSHQPDFATHFGQEAITNKTRNMVGWTAAELGQKNDLPGLRNFQASLAQLMPKQAEQWQDLATIKYLLGQPQRNWPAYVNATLAYGQRFAAQDNYTLYEATAYLAAFVNDKALLAKGDQIIQQAIAADRSHFYLLTRAKLLHKLGNDAEATTAATEAIAAATKAGANPDEATAFLAEIKK
ncbi:hypothetical protein AUC43_16680 [Hymenobacter sedentarius]|uniref:Thioredoxin domain-containing protein n=1 Tax=Hymenobacter sedentarius TaxID=1411621 RepID=A0A0U4AEH6_9BACT|nr:thioredoxin family protein [Hymenobacter sedentarius]ALW86572.1 hypothetical protein AUC43_16680 [Hymenobacter sedentarius]